MRTEQYEEGYALGVQAERERVLRLLADEATTETIWNAVDEEPEPDGLSFREVGAVLAALRTLVAPDTPEQGDVYCGHGFHGECERDHDHDEPLAPEQGGPPDVHERDVRQMVADAHERSAAAHTLLGGGFKP